MGAKKSRGRFLKHTPYTMVLDQNVVPAFRGLLCDCLGPVRSGTLQLFKFEFNELEQLKLFKFDLDQLE